MPEPSPAESAIILKSLPSVERLLRDDRVKELVSAYSHGGVVQAIRDILDEERQLITAGQPARSRDALVAAVTDHANRLWRPSLRPLINATGVIIHTNLGRAPMSKAAMAAVQSVAGGYSNLEFDLASGERGSRHSHLEGLLARLVGAEASLVVNNNAAAVLLALSATAKGKEVVVSRGQAVEIGGRFRIPEVIRQSGCRLVEVGTTNRTRLSDYEEAITSRTAALLHVHASNFKVIGFTEDVAIGELADLARRHGLVAVDDLGSGTLIDTALFGLAHEPMVQESLAAGADLVCFSGDKLLGGPQAGLVVGRRVLIDRLRRAPLARAVRVDKCTIAALQATLLHYLRGEAERHIPVWRMIAAPLPELEARALRWVEELRSAGVAASVMEGESTVGGGSLPGEVLPTRLVAVAIESGAATAKRRKPSAGAAVGKLAARLRLHDPPVVGRVDRGLLLLDPRTVGPDEETILLAAVKEAAAATGLGAGASAAG